MSSVVSAPDVGDRVLLEDDEDDAADEELEPDSDFSVCVFISSS
jgi:hypothetical protein